VNISKVPLAASKVLFGGQLSRYRVTKMVSVFKMSRHGKFDHCLTIRGNVIVYVLYKTTN
jgi:hypothetical protein